MGVFVLLPLVLPLTAWPMARLAAHRLHPRAATLLLSGASAALGLCSTLCLGLLAIVGTAQLPGNPLPDSWAEPEVREAVPQDEVVGETAVGALAAAFLSGVSLLVRHCRVRRRTERALKGLPGGRVAVLPDQTPYAHTVPGRLGRIVVSTGMLANLDSAARRVLFAHERSHLANRHHRYLLLAGLAARLNPCLRPLRTALAYTVERWADEDAARAVGDRLVTARAVGAAALISQSPPAPFLTAFAAPGPVPRRVAALLGPAPNAPTWQSLFTSVGLAAWAAAAGTALSAMSSANSAVTLFLILRAVTPL
ncbi:M56 family metallopeptidase [Streptomyces sp. TS71-3]|uniref:M56 family metallopeptidase n=1 Tax=Streptomyces sp. TS71-3 TaxID=2733862 RepID=UPI001B0F5EA1|nr:M56 family metallopeptidase [Streptomyces sp. TS71-3]GHJ41301.1 membrane protein [Streptomyces sp. TS71-3]